MIGAICHEIGHNVFGSVPKDPFEDNSITGSMMNISQGEGQVRRSLINADIAFAQKKFGKVPTPSLIKMQLETAEQINYDSNVVFHESATLITISGKSESTSVFKFIQLM